MNRSVANLLLVAAFACVGCKDFIAEQQDTDPQINAPKEEVVNQIVTTHISEPQMGEVENLLATFPLHNQEGEVISIIVLRRSESGDVTQEQITRPLEALVARANPDHCYGRLDDWSKIVRGEIKPVTSVWCQRRDYEEQAKKDRRLEWDMHHYGNPALFFYEADPAHKCFKTDGSPNRRYLTQVAHSKLCYGKL